ncbi:uncharacterized protein ColSpa_09249 [Colletotrichum spaethianum]|uniref:Fungal N-terminal domain-containing protein n=1 Tax=Colletotrichum spaethianum TaxID=700344 RepID=A0AA37US04_9PEZI|nr:uncharacterized protein ColSpa_09249 [Colletotrichum spaethianum]GKT49068.1 hypothetical protein ColSpa_09249 [Colletotrichum spaethianum]
MADPLSIAASCVGLITAAGATAKAVSAFVRDCREARADLTTVARELADLQIILELLRDDGDGGHLPHPLRAQIVSIVDSCGGVIQGIDAVLERHKGRRGPLRWAIDGKREVEALQRGLEAYRSSLSLAVETVTLTLAKSIKNDTEVIRDQTKVVPAIKDDTERILEEIEHLRVSLPGEGPAWSTNARLEEYLDGLTSYAETVCDEVVWESEEEGDATNPEDAPTEDGSSTLQPEEEDPEEGIPEEEKPGRKDPPPASEPGAADCHGCGSSTNETGDPLQLLKCGHRLCDGCIYARFSASMLKESTKRPRCCEAASVFPGHATHLLDKQFKRRWNRKFGDWTASTVTCPAAKCRRRRRIMVDNWKRELIWCGGCSAKICTRCQDRWHVAAVPCQQGPF